MNAVDGARRRVAVVGGGIAGLSAAFELRRNGVAVEVFDPSDRPGGKLRTSPFAGIDLDESADMFLARLPWGVQLCRDLGLEAQLISPAIGSALLVVDGTLKRLPEGLVLGVPTDLDSLAASGLLSDEGLARVAADLTAADLTAADVEPAPAAKLELDGDVTVGDLVRSRLGDEAFEVLVDPLLSGVNAGRADELSAELGAAQLLAAARRDPSLIRAVRAQLPVPEPGQLRPPIFVAVPGGMGRLVAALVEAIGPESIHTGTTVEAIDPTDIDPSDIDPTDIGSGAAGGGAVLLRIDGVSHRFDAAVVATPAPVTAALVRPHAARVADALAALRYASVAVVALAYRGEDVPGPLDASGFLVPRREGLFLTACSFASAKFPHLGADGLVRMRASVGRSDDTRFLELDDAEIVRRVRVELGDLMGIEAEPVTATVHRWIDALPQYRPGHGDRVDALQSELRAALPQIELAGASLRGLGVPACIDSGRRAAQLLLR